MQDTNWSTKEKQIARAAFERAAMAEEQELLEACRAKAAGTRSLDDMRAIEAWIRESLREYQYKYDYRYSQLILVLARLVREGRVPIESLDGLKEDKMNSIKSIAAL